MMLARPAATIMLAMLALPGCSGDDATPQSKTGGAAGVVGSGGAAGNAGSPASAGHGGTAGVPGSAGAGGSAGMPAAAFAIDGSWSYLGPSDVPHDLAITDTSMAYTAEAGDWSSHWTITTYDNALHHFQVVFDSGSGSYLPSGQSMSGTYDVSGAALTIQLAQGLTSYPELTAPGTCTAPADGTPVPECRLYIKHN